MTEKLSDEARHEAERVAASVNLLGGWLLDQRMHRRGVRLGFELGAEWQEARDAGRIEALEAEAEQLRARYYNATAGSRHLRPGEAKKLTEALDSRVRATAAEATLDAVRELIERGVKVADPMLAVSVGYSEACSDVLAILNGDGNERETE